MSKHKITIAEAVRLWHEHLRLFREIFEDEPMESFGEINQEQLLTGVHFLTKAMRQPDLSEEDFHELWCAWKYHGGYSPGPGRDRDKKIRSSLVPYSNLTEKQKYKVGMMMDFAKRITPLIE